VESALSTARGLSAFHDRHYEEALADFESAVNADPEDIEARFHRGVTLGRLKQYDRALLDLRRVVEALPKFHQAQLELGIVLLNSEQPKLALPWLSKAAGDEELRHRAALYEGIAYLRVGNLEKARSLFERAAEDRSLYAAARYYLGFVAYTEHRWGEATEHFNAVQKTDAGKDMQHEAEEFIALMSQGSLTAYELHASASYAYDSNVVLAPDDEADDNPLRISDQGDNRFLLAAGGSVALLRESPVELVAAYDFAQTLYVELNDFNQQTHAPAIRLATQFDPVQLGIEGGYVYSLLQTSSFYHQGTALPWVRVREGRLGRIESYYRFRRRHYVLEQLDEPLDANNHAAGIRQVFELGSAERPLWIGYRFDYNDAVHEVGKEFQYNGQEAEAGIAWSWPAIAVATQLRYHFRYEDYAPESQGRDDYEHGINFSIGYQLTKNLALRAEYLGTFNDSDQDRFTYERHIGGIALDVTL
jgi:tetratricopeptide (TPR) repeat protein